MDSNKYVDVSHENPTGPHPASSMARALPRHDENQKCFKFASDLRSDFLGDKLVFIINYFLTELHQVSDIDNIWDVFMALGPELGFDNLAYQHLTAPGAPRQDGRELGRSWCSSDEVGALLKSLDKTSQDAGLAVLFDLHKPQTLTRCIKSLGHEGVKVDLLSAFAVRNFPRGYIFPVFANHGRNGFVIINMQAGLSVPREALLLWMCQMAHLKYDELSLARQNPAIKLSNRERQVLYWVARGKSNSVIASIIGISPHTVNGYLRKIYLKTNTSDRTTAAIYAIRIGAIL